MVQALVKTMEYSIQWILHYGNVLKVVEMMITQKNWDSELFKTLLVRNTIISKEYSLRWTD